MFKSPYHAYKKTSGEAPGVDIGIPISLLWQFELSRPLPYQTHFRQICTNQRLSERRRYRVTAARSLFVFGVASAHVIAVDDVPLREALRPVQLVGLEHAPLRDGTHKAGNLRCISASVTR